MRHIEVARDTKNAVLHVGTNAIFRRKYVDEIGGYPTKSITEDMALGLLLQAQGYESIFINKTLVCGLSATTYPSLVRQRDRWARGNLQVLKNYRKTIHKKLNLQQKLIYIDGAIYWFSGLIKLIYIITPIIYLLTGMIVVNIPPQFLLPLFITAFTSQILTSKLILPKSISSHYTKFFLRGELYSTIIAPHMAFSVMKHYLLSDMKFSVTPKSSIPKKNFYLKLSLPHIVLLVLSIVAIAVGTLNLNKNIYYQPYFINLFWILYNIPPLILSVKLAYQPKRRATDECIPVKKSNQATVQIDGKLENIKIVKISENYIFLNFDNPNIKNVQLGQLLVINMGNAIYKCIVKEIFEDHVVLQYNEELSYEQYSNLMDIILNNLEPYGNNINM